MLLFRQVNDFSDERDPLPGLTWQEENSQRILILDRFKCLDLIVNLQRTHTTTPKSCPLPPLGAGLPLAHRRPAPAHHRRAGTSPPPPSWYLTATAELELPPPTLLLLCLPAWAHAAAEVRASVGSYRRRQCATQQQAGATGGWGWRLCPGAARILCTESSAVGLPRSTLRLGQIWSDVDLAAAPRAEAHRQCGGQGGRVSRMRASNARQHSMAEIGAAQRGLIWWQADEWNPPRRLVV
jgi:hypothetical protein